MKTFAITSLLALASAAMGAPGADDSSRSRCYNFKDYDVTKIIGDYNNIIRGVYGWERIDLLTKGYTFISHTWKTGHDRSFTEDGIVTSSKKDFYNLLRKNNQRPSSRVIDWTVKCNDIWVYSRTDPHTYGFSKHSIVKGSGRNDKWQISQTIAEYDGARGDDDYNDDGKDGKDDNNKHGGDDN